MLSVAKVRVYLPLRLVHSWHLNEHPYVVLSAELLSQGVHFGQQWPRQLLLERLLQYYIHDKFALVTERGEVTVAR